VRLVKVTDTDSAKVLASRVEVADTFLSRSVGLMLRPTMGSADGMLITECRAVHTCLVRFPIDLLFIARDGMVLRAVHNLRPWRVSPVVWRAWAVLELPAGTVAQTETQTGHRVRIDPVAER
jgi:uncharacterized membrane protein (UPF0127 family)